MVRRAATVVAIVLLAACGGGAETPSLPPADAYETYLANNPDPSIVLTREEAATRAALGCRIDWPEGTIDYVLRQAYRASC